MGFFRSLWQPKRSSAQVAKERLKIVLAHERAGNRAPDFLPILQRELLAVVGRYVEISEEMIRVTLGNSGDTSLLEINIEIEGGKLKKGGSGPALSAAV
jgi:cell division topological specificity factor